MIINRLIVPEGNYLTFTLNHKVGGEVYELKPGETYYMKIAASAAPTQSLLQFITSDNSFNLSPELDEGRYVFEIGVKDSRGFDNIILPALDDRRCALNELIVLKRLED